MIDIFLFIILAICVTTDLKSRMIYNNVIYPALLMTFIFHFATGGWDALSHSFIGFLIGFGLLLIPYFMGGMGAGDVKLLGLIGALKGGAFVFQSFLYTAIVGAIMAIIIILIRRGMLKSLLYFIASLKSGVVLKGGISKGSLTATYPYGVAIAAGTVVSMVLAQGWVVL
ncbi:prepilin peptidase CpaA [Oceanobacillus limi]|uniref:Prepilin peptidase CpaA n=1 Tax=Oceanobacillus limi TaxID=930131 RepID=A0A1I0BIF1_9BACI|nr:prepilin peptidase [Oceanobacillus limi]SET06015.1 prepilin peptidase CpaA [Oceanobacillus limi]